MQPNSPTLGTAAMSLVSGFFDESILVREARRLRTQKRWQILIAAFLVCGLYALPLVLSLLGQAQQEGASNLFGNFVQAVCLCSCVAAFYYSMQVLRHELWTQTLEGLFLTLQKDRPVILSIVACGGMAGLAPLVLFLPLIVFASALLAVSAIQVVAAICVMVAAVFASAALGGLWFFVGQRLFTVKVTPVQVVLNAVGIVGVTFWLWYFRYPFHGSSATAQRLETMCVLMFWGSMLYSVVAAAVWSARSVYREASYTRRRRESIESTRMALLAAGALLLFIAITAFSLLSAVGLRYGDHQIIHHFLLPMSSLGVFTPAAAAAHLVGASRGVGLEDSHFWSEIGPWLAASMTAFLLLLGMGASAVSCLLYRSLRESPEKAAATLDRLQVTQVGLDDWKGFRNPILTRELRTRLRNGDARIFIAVAALLSAAAGLIPLLSSFGGEIRATQIADLARQSFMAVGIVQLAIACLIGPGIGAEVIAAEKERKTFEMLVTSRLSAREILTGKMQGSMALLLLLLSPSFPLLALAAFLHGVTASMVLGMIAVLVFFIYILSVVCVSISALARSSVTGKWTAYLVAGVLFAMFSWIPAALPTFSVDDLPRYLGLMFAAACFLALWVPAVEKIRAAGRSGMNRNSLQYPMRISTAPRR